jgi:malate dehydrogenase (oxaloacetate-decarboxylating)(NADP+)
VATLRCRRPFSDSRLETETNLLIMPTVDAANIAYNLLSVAAGNGITIGPILLGTARPVHILESTVSVRGIVNMTALAVVDFQRGRP